MLSTTYRFFRRSTTVLALTLVTASPAMAVCKHAKPFSYFSGIAEGPVHGLPGPHFCQIRLGKRMRRNGMKGVLIQFSQSYCVSRTTGQMGPPIEGAFRLKGCRIVAGWPHTVNGQYTKGKITKRRLKVELLGTDTFMNLKRER